MSYKITKIKARQILDSRGNPTIETTVYAGDDFAVASVPSGASTGSHEAIELRDDKKSFKGLSVQSAIKNVEGKLARSIKGMDCRDQVLVDKALIDADGTLNKSKLGANSILSISMAVARLAAKQEGVELYQYLSNLANKKGKYKMPTMLLNVINGGRHADSGLDIQEFFLIPKKGKFEKRVEDAWLVIRRLESELHKQNLSTELGDEGGFAPKLHSNEKALRLLKKAIQDCGYKLGEAMALGLDAAASEFFDADKQIYRLKADRKTYKPVSMYKLYQKWISQYHIEVIEDGCAEDDLTGWQKLSETLGDEVKLVGDDLFVTQSQRLHAGIVAGIANSVLIKLNQVGTVTETLATIELAQKYGYKVVVSHRSGETNDDFIADLAVAVRCDYIKAGSLARGERLAKYNRLLQIADKLGK